jgi:ABC-type nitrate/sulfonate/bicarbonate transport system substrate-binding protein
MQSKTAVFPISAILVFFVSTAPLYAQKESRQLRVVVFSVDAATAVARSRGLFAAEGMDVEIRNTTSSAEQMRSLGEGRIEIVSTAFDNVLAWSGKAGSELAAVAQTDKGVNLPVYARPEIRSWNDLKGKKLAVDATDTGYALVLRRLLLAHGLDLKRGDYELVAVGSTGKRLATVLEGQTSGAIINNLAAQAKANAAGLRRLGDHREVMPDYPGVVFAVSRSWAQSRRAELVGFLRAWLAGLRWASEPANHSDAIALMMKDGRTGSETAAANLSELTADGSLNVRGLQSVLDLRNQFGLTPTMGSRLEPYYDLSYHRDALRP